MSSLLKNKISSLINYLSDNEHIKFILLLGFSILISFGLSSLSGVYTFLISIPLLICISILAIFKEKLKFNFDHSLYEIPIINEKIVITKKFKFDLNKVDNRINYINNKLIIDIPNNTKFKVINTEEIKCDFIITLELLSSDNFSLKGQNILALNASSSIIRILYSDIKKYYKTMTDLREYKLNKILK